MAAVVAWGMQRERGDVFCDYPQDLWRVRPRERTRVTSRTPENTAGKRVVPFTDVGKLKEESGWEDKSLAVFGTPRPRACPQTCQASRWMCTRGSQERGQG